MNRRDVLASVGVSVMVPGVVRGSESVVDEWMSPDEYRRRRPDSLDGMEVEESEWDIESVGTRIESVYRREHPALRIIYVEDNDFQLWVGGTNIVYYPESVSEGVEFLKLFNEQVSYRVVNSESGFYGSYAIEDWTATTNQNYTDGEYIAVIDGQRELFEDSTEMRDAVQTAVLERIDTTDSSLTL